MCFVSTVLPSTISDPVARAKTLAVGFEVEHQGVVAGFEFVSGPYEAFEIQQIVKEDRSAPAYARDPLAQVKPVAAKASALGDNHTFGSALGNIDVRGDLVRPIENAGC